MEMRPTPAEARLVDRLLKRYGQESKNIGVFQKSLYTAFADSDALAPHVHSMKSRLKDPDHLRRKLVRRIADSKEEGTKFDVTPENLLTAINDLAGIRILHLYTHQIRDIDAAIREIVQEQRYSLVEEPFARTWDDESREFFRTIGIETQQSPTMYSVHYVVGSASKTLITCEVQVRTLMEEVWGEVDHTINYPEETEILSCREQLKVLARVTSAGSRLVDSIFLTWEQEQAASRGGFKPFHWLFEKLGLR
jgi:putative GTP pyrophosphokinase